MKTSSKQLHARITLRGLLIDAMRRQCESSYGKNSATAKSETIKAMHGRHANRLLYAVDESK